MCSYFRICDEQCKALAKIHAYAKDRYVRKYPYQQPKLNSITPIQFPDIIFSNNVPENRRGLMNIYDFSHLGR